MAWTAPFTFTAGYQPTAAKFNEQIRDNLNIVAAAGIAGFTDYSASATWTAVTTDPTYTVNTARYCQLGKLVVYVAKFTVTTAGSGVYSWSLPVTAQAAANVACGQGTLADADLTDGYTCVMDVTTTTTLRGVNDQRTDTGILSSSVPFTWAVTDVVTFAVYYEAA